MSRKFDLPRSVTPTKAPNTCPCAVRIGTVMEISGTSRFFPTTGRPTDVLPSLIAARTYSRSMKLVPTRPLERGMSATAVPSSVVIKVPPLKSSSRMGRCCKCFCSSSGLRINSGLISRAMSSREISRSCSSWLTSAATKDALDNCWSPNTRSISACRLRVIKYDSDQMTSRRINSMKTVKRILSE